MIREPSLIAEHVHKQFPGVKALDNVSIKAYAGEATALIGINGAGKSTLMNVLAGEIAADSGDFTINGKKVHISRQADAEANSIALIHQEAVVFPDMTVAENVFITSIERFRRNGMIRHSQMRQEAVRYLDMLGCRINPAELVRNVTVGERQMIEIARALALGAEILLFDEPTSSLTIKEKDKLFEIIRALKKQGKTVIYITHFIGEVLQICESAFVMRDGRVVGACPTKEMTVKDFITMMLGSNVEAVVNDRTVRQEKLLLQVKDLVSLPAVKHVSFELYEGEILGIWGLLGSGRTELVRAMLRLGPVDAGEVLLQNAKTGKLERVVNRALLHETGYVTENRHHDGLFMQMPIWKNITMPNMRRFSRILNNKKAEIKYSEELIQRLNVKTPDCHARVDKLSGGNQQKVIMARWVGKEPRLFILDEPTRGVDVGAKAAIHSLILELAKAGKTVLLISSEIEEIAALSDRVLVLSEGESVAEVPKEEISSHRLMELCVKKEAIESEKDGAFEEDW